jgi:hypothetical protein
LKFSVENLLVTYLAGTFFKRNYLRTGSRADIKIGEVSTSFFCDLKTNITLHNNCENEYLHIWTRSQSCYHDFTPLAISTPQMTVFFNFLDFNFNQAIAICSEMCPDN